MDFSLKKKKIGNFGTAHLINELLIKFNVYCLKIFVNLLVHEFIKIKDKFHNPLHGYNGPCTT